MKKFFFSILAVGAIVACTKSEVTYDDASELSFAPVASNVTKVNGAIDGTVYPTAEDFRVWAYWKDVPESSDHADFTGASKYIDAKRFTYKEYTDLKLWKGKSQTYYWPKTGSLVFACLSPADAAIEIDENTHDVVTDKFEFTYVNPYDTKKTRDIMWSDCTISYTEQTEGVPVKFNHALSWITFKVQGKPGDAVLNGGFKINSITINKVNTKARFVSSNKSWNYQQEPKDYVVFEGSKNLTATPEVIETNPQGTLVIPQTQDAGYIATLVYTNNLGDTPIVETIDLQLGAGWQLGIHYIYTITFSSNEILIAPTIEGWDEEVKPGFEF